MSDSRDVDPGEWSGPPASDVVVEVGGRFDAALMALAACVDELLAVDFAAATPAELIGFVREWEVQQRRAVAVTHAVVAGLGVSGAPGELGYRDPAALLVDVLRLSPGEARARWRAAEDFGPRQSLAGEMLAPQFEQVAAAQRAGVISAAHAKVIVSALDTLSPQADVEQAGRVQAVLVGHAGELNPIQLGSVAARVLAHLDPDGRVPVQAEQQRRRDLTLTASADGSGWLQGRLTPELLAVLQTVLEPLSAPVPAVDGPADLRTADPRTAGQRRHDGLLDLCQLALRSGELPHGGGVPTTLVLTISEQEYRARRGFATTPFGGLIPAVDAARLAHQAEVYLVALSASGGILDYGRSRRFGTTGQRFSIYGRDRGCTFPGCDAPLSRTQLHHVIDWAHGGRTATDSMTLLCGHHHRTFEQMGWTVTMRDGVPWWTPPQHLDPHQRPQQNHHWTTPTID